MKKQDLGIYIGLVLTGILLVAVLPLIRELGMQFLVDYRFSTGFIILFLIFIIVFFCFFIFLAISRFTSQEDQKVVKLKQERIAIQEKISEKTASNNIIDIIQLNLNQLDEYYTINKTQARNSFYTSLFLIFLGFFTITVAIVISLSNPSLNIGIPVISGISGVLLQFIGGANFFIYSKTIEQVNRFYNNLIKTQDTMLAIELCRQIDDEEKRRNLIERVVIDLLKRSSLYASELIRFTSTEESNKFNQRENLDENSKNSVEKKNANDR
jgi:protein-S-isoprenylcysteine O-methyltransferase Ste14